eukprot:363635-Chlamydomonas_euryale.AAC.3
MVDVGCGIGGSSRFISQKLGCSARGITLSPKQAARANELTAREGLSDRASFQVWHARGYGTEAKMRAAGKCVGCGAFPGVAPFPGVAYIAGGWRKRASGRGGACWIRGRSEGAVQCGEQ